MAAGDVTVVSWDASDSAAAKTAIETLTIVVADKLVTWRHGGKAYAAKYEV